MIVLDNGGKLRGDATAPSVIDYSFYGLDNNVLKQLGDGQLPSTTGDLYTSDSVDVVSTIILVNTDSVVRQVNLFMLPSAGTARRILPKDLSLNPGYSAQWSGDKVTVMNTSGGIVQFGGWENLVEDTTPQLGGTLDTNNYAINTSYATVASNSTISPIWDATGNIIDFTGTETITDFPEAPQAGVSRTLICAGASVFTHAGNISVQGSSTFTAEVGDEVTVTAITTTTFKLTIKKADGEAVTTGLVADFDNEVASTPSVTLNTAKITFDSTSSTKLGTIEESAEVNVPSDWDSVSGDSLILNKPTTITGAQALEITANTAKITFDSTSSTKLGTIEGSADVTDATNVEASGAVMESDATTASMSFVLDEDTMSSNSSTKLPTQQSVKAYVDNNTGGVTESQLSSTSFINALIFG